VNGGDRILAPDEVKSSPSSRSRADANLLASFSSRSVLVRHLGAHRTASSSSWIR
jgi:hypothetical protein